MTLRGIGWRWFVYLCSLWFLSNFQCHLSGYPSGQYQVLSLRTYGMFSGFHLFSEVSSSPYLWGRQVYPCSCMGYLWASLFPLLFNLCMKWVRSFNSRGWDIYTQLYNFIRNWPSDAVGSSVSMPGLLGCLDGEEKSSTQLQQDIIRVLLHTMFLHSPRQNWCTLRRFSWTRSSCSNSSWITMAGRRLCIALHCTSIVPLGGTVHGHLHFRNWPYSLLYCTIHGAALINYIGPSVNLEWDNMDDYGYIYIMPMLHSAPQAALVPMYSWMQFKVLVILTYHVLYMA